jgi:hypothetical protein
MHPDDRERVSQEMRETYAGKRSAPIRFRWIARDNHVIWVETRTALIRGADGEAVGMQGHRF